MEFRFNLQPYFTQPIIKVNSNLLPHTFRGDRRSVLDATSKIAEIINTMGELSAKAQGLNKPVTTAQKLRMSDGQIIYLLADPQAGKSGAVIGLLKVGKKSLYVFDENGETKMVNAPCVLDFYVHESRQRTGLGKELFQTMLAEENFQPEKMAVDRPSDKLLGFLKKHYGLQRTIPQMNNFVVYDGFFDKPSSNNNNQEVVGSGGGNVHLTDSPNTALFGPQFNTNEEQRKLKPVQKASPGNMPQIQSSPVGRYAAPRPMCSMAECLRYYKPEQIEGGRKPAVMPSPTAAAITGINPNNLGDTISDNNQIQKNLAIQENQVPMQCLHAHPGPVSVQMSETLQQQQQQQQQPELQSNQIVPMPVQLNQYPQYQNYQPAPCNAATCSYYYNHCCLHGPFQPLPCPPMAAIEASPNNQTQYVSSNNTIAPNESDQNEQMQNHNSGLQPDINKTILEKKLYAEKRAGLQGVKMHNFGPSNTSIQTCGMAADQNNLNESPQNQNQNLISGTNQNYTPRNTPEMGTNQIQANNEPPRIQSVNPSEPVEQTQVQLTKQLMEECPPSGNINASNHPEVGKIEEFQEVCPKCSATFTSSRAQINNPEMQVNQKNGLNTANEMIIHNSATPATGEPNSEASTQKAEQHSDDAVSSLNVEIESLQIDDNDQIVEPEQEESTTTDQNGHREHQQQQQQHEDQEDQPNEEDINSSHYEEDEHIKKSVYVNKLHTGLKNLSYNVGMAVTPSTKMEFDQEQPESFGVVKINRPIGKTASSPIDNTDAESHVSSEGYTDQGYLDLKFYHNRLW